MTGEAIAPLRVELTHATAIFTTRLGGVSSPPYDSLNLGPYVGDDPADVAANLDAVRRYADLERLLTVRQVHGSTIVDADGIAGEAVEADGMIGTRRGDGLLVTVADCFPVALATASRVAMLHCGWRPLSAGIIERALELLGDEPVDAAIGPGIGDAAYEVGPEVAAAFGAAAEGRYRDGRLDLRGIIRDKLGGAQRIETVEGCTYSNPSRFFSHRRDGAPTGRQAGVVWRT